MSVNLQIKHSRNKCTKSYFCSGQAGLINKEQGSRTAVKSKLVFFTSLKILFLFINKHGALGPAGEEEERKGPIGAMTLENIKTSEAMLANTLISQTGSWVPGQV